MRPRSSKRFPPMRVWGPERRSRWRSPRASAACTICRPISAATPFGSGAVAAPASASGYSIAAASSSTPGAAARRHRRRSSVDCGFRSNGASSWCSIRAEAVCTDRRKAQPSQRLRRFRNGKPRTFVVSCSCRRCRPSPKELQSRVGDYFAPIQGGSRFTSPDVAAALARLDEAGAYGIGQSSWGPTGFAFASSAAEASRLVALLRDDARLRALDIRACTGLNRGAQIDVHSALDSQSG